MISNIGDEIINENYKSIIKNATNTYGSKNQIITAIEELSELQKVLCKLIRTDSATVAKRQDMRSNHLIEELVDVLICIEIITQEYNITPEELNSMMKKKMNRMEERLRSYPNNKEEK